MVVIGTFAWNTFRILRVAPLSATIVMLLVTVVTVLEDLAVAVVVGVIVSALQYAWANATRIGAKSSTGEGGEKIYSIEGPLFFGSASGFEELFTPKTDPNAVIVDFANSRVADQSALSAIEAVAQAYQEQGKTLHLRGLAPVCRQLLSRTGMIIDTSPDDPDYGVAVDYSVKIGLFAEH